MDNGRGLSAVTIGWLGSDGWDSFTLFVVAESELSPVLSAKTGLGQKNHADRADTVIKMRPTKLVHTKISWHIFFI
jgi:hypothetical protein